MSRRPRPLWLRLALRTFPARFRGRFAADLAATAERHLRDAYGGSRLRQFLDLCRNGLGARWDDLRLRSGRSAGRDPLPEGSPTVMESILRDLGYALRALRQSPGFTAVAVLSLALGIGANAALFGVVDAALLQVLPVASPHELSALHWYGGPEGRPDVSTSGWAVENEMGRSESSSFAWQHFRSFRELGADLGRFVAFAELRTVNLRVGSESTLAGGQLVSGDYYRVLGVRPALGRLLGPDDDRPDAAPAAVLTYRFWSGRFGGDPGVIGSELYVNGTAFTVVGVSEPGFSGALQVGAQPDVTLPVAFHEPLLGRGDLFARAEYLWLHVIVRRADGVTPEQLQARLDPAFKAQVAAAVEEPDPGRVPTLRAVDGARGMTELRGLIDDGLWNMTWVVALILLIACANLANLLLARASARRRELAVRASIGASRSRLVRQLLTESLLLSGLGGAAGLLVAFYGHGLFVGLADSRMELDVAIDGRVLAFTGVVSAATGLLFGLLPALRSTRVDLNPALRQGAPASAGGGLPASRTMLAVQAALSILLLVVAGLFVRNLQGLAASAVNFDPDRVVVMSVAPALNQYQDGEALAFYREALDRIRAVPGVSHATVTNHPPVSGTMTSRGIRVLGYEPAEEEWMGAYVNVVGGEFFETFGIPLLAGRRLDEQDMAAGPTVAVVNEEFVRRFVPDGSPLGVRFGWAADEGTTPIEVVGVVADVAYQTLDDSAWPAVHVPFPQLPSSLGRMTFGVRGAGDPTALVPLLSDTIAEVDPNLPVHEVRTLAEQRDHTLQTERQFARIATLAGALAILLASIGMYGTLSYTVLRRRREIGVRMALGAAQRQVVGLVLRELRPVLLGIGLGLVASYWATGLVEAQLHEINPTDPLALVVATSILAAVALAAAWLPMRRAAALDPMEALREE